MEQTGKSLICSGTTNTYYVPGLPCGATVSYNNIDQSHVVGGPVPYSINSNTISITNPNQGISGYITFTATVSTACGTSDINASLNFSAGPPSPELTPNWVQVCPNSGVGFSASAANATTFNWDWDHNSMTYNSGGAGSSAIGFRTNFDFSSGWVSVSAANVCGTGPTHYLGFGRPPYCPNSFAYSVSPNPVSTTLTINSVETAKPPAQKGIVDVQIIDKMGYLKKRVKYGKGTLSSGIDISTLAADSYIVRIFDGKTWEEHRIVVVR